MFEALEARTLLGGDHPSLSNFPNATVLPIESTRYPDLVRARGSGLLEVVGDNDLFAFTAASSGRRFRPRTHLPSSVLE